MSLLHELKENENLRKIFGERELKIIEKQLLGISLTQSEKNRLSRDIRKKLEAIRDLIVFKKEFRLKKGEYIREIIEETKKEILNHELFPRIKEIILFGSYAENDPTFRSDIDIAVKFDNISVAEATKFRINVLGGVSDKVDVQVYNVLPEKVRKEIDKYGKIIYRSKE